MNQMNRKSKNNSKAIIGIVIGVLLMIAIILGGKLFGLTGMILFIPLMAVIYTLVREDANQRILRKQALTEGKPTT